MRRHRHTEGEQAPINMTPMLDIVFILLIFFLVATSFSREVALPVQLSDGRAAASAGAAPVVVSIDSGGRFQVAGEPVVRDQLVAALSPRLATLTERRVLIVAERSTPAARLVQAVDAARLAGASDIALAEQSP